MSLAYDVYRETIQNGGHSVNIGTGKSPREGFCVSLQNYELAIPLADFTPAAIDRYVAEHKGALNRADRLLGTWIDNGKVYLDVSITTDDSGHAKTLAKLHKQLAYYDVRKGEAVTL